MIKFPIQKNDDPDSNSCVYCGLDIANGVAYVSGGAYYAGENGVIGDAIKEKKGRYHLGFLNIGFHGNPDSLSADVCVVDDVYGGQYDISFCSLDCMKQWFNCIFNKIESELDQKRHETS